MSGELALMQLADYLRCEQGLCGTKIVCAEGDCGACSVLIGRVTPGGKLDYKPLNSCIQAMYQLDCSHVITVEGLNLERDQLNPIQQSMVDCHGAQCGYCTPGFVMTLAALFDGCSKSCAPAVTRQDVKGALTGNLCRCTGYESIIKSALECDAQSMKPLEELYPQSEMLRAFAAHATVDVRIETSQATIFIPHEVSSAVQFKRSNEGTVIVSGGTDVGVNINKRAFKPRNILSTCNLQGLDELITEDRTLTVGARVTLEQLARYVKDNVPELHEFYKILWVFGAPQIRYAGTLAGNIANASPIGDSLPFLFVMEAAVEVTGVHGTRRIPINSLYTGYKKLDMSNDEIITRIFIPLPKANQTLRLFKISKREHLDISSFAAAFLVDTDLGGIGDDPGNGVRNVTGNSDGDGNRHVDGNADGNADGNVGSKGDRTSHPNGDRNSNGDRNKNGDGNHDGNGDSHRVAAVGTKISAARIAFGGVGPVVLRLPETESFLQGKNTTFETFGNAGALALKEITPIGDVRGSVDFRRQLAENIFLKFWSSLEERTDDLIPV